MNTSFLKQRLLYLLAGTSLNALGITLITKAYLGTSPISCMPFVLSLGLKPSFGTLTFVFNMLFLLGQMIILKKAFPPIQLLQIPVTVLFGFLIDIFMFFFQNVKPENYIYSLLLLVSGCLVMGFGITLSVHADLVMTPGNAFVQALHICTKKPFGNVKIAFDTVLTFGAVVCSFALFGTFRGVREGSVISAFLVGAFINFFQAHLPLTSWGKSQEEPSAPDKCLDTDSAPTFE